MLDFMLIEIGIWFKDIRGFYVIDCGFIIEIRKFIVLYSIYLIYRIIECSMYFLIIFGLCILVVVLLRVKR